MSICQPITVRHTYDVPRWAKLSRLIEDEAFMLQLECLVNVRRGLIMEHGRFAVTGDRDNVRKFMARFAAGATKYSWE